MATPPPGGESPKISMAPGSAEEGGPIQSLQGLRTELAAPALLYKSANSNADCTDPVAQGQDWVLPGSC